MSVEAALVAHVATRSSGQRYEDLWEHDPVIHRLLQESESPEVGRERLFNYLKDLEWKYRCGQLDGHKLDWATAMEALGLLQYPLAPQ